MSLDHDDALARAFDEQAAKFERAPTQSDPLALERLVAFADFPPDALVLDAGCGPGLVALALLESGRRVVGCDLSQEMIARARARCLSFADRARFERKSVFDEIAGGPFDAAISRFVAHHVPDPHAFLGRQAELLRPGGVVVVCDHTTDPDPERARRHNEIELLRDQTHVRCLDPGELVNLAAAAGLEAITMREETFILDFDEWFDRGTTEEPKSRVRELMLAYGPARGFAPILGDDGAIAIRAVRAMVRGVKPAC